MRSTSAEPPAPLLVLGLGNPLLRDDGVGLELLARLHAETRDAPEVEWTDGGTQGLALLGRLAQRRGVLVLDAVGRGAAPGTVHELDAGAALRAAATGGATAHEGGAGPLLAASALLGDLPDDVVVVGVEPGEVRTGLGLSDAVSAALPAALARAGTALERLRARLPATVRD